MRGGNRPILLKALENSLTMGPDKVNGGFSGNPKQGNQDSTMYPSIFPPDFAFWKLTPPALGLLGLGIYVGFRKQV